MNEIVAKQELAPKIQRVDVCAPEIADEARPGQFVILRIDETGERFPLSVAGVDPSEGTVRLVFAEVGKSTTQFGKLREGDEVLDVVGPLGNPTEIDRYGRVLCVGGGVMVAPLHFATSALRDAGNEIIGVIGARDKDGLIFKDAMESVCHTLYVATDDGSEGHKGLGFISWLVKEQGISRVVTMGSVVTMRAVSELTKPHGIKTIVSLSPIMVDGTGMCGCCRVSVGGKTRYACIDGPEFDGHEVDWDLLISRKYIFLPEERLSSLLYERSGGCVHES